MDANSEISKEELMRVVFESQKQVADLTKLMKQKDNSLEQVTKELKETQKKLHSFSNTSVCKDEIETVIVVENAENLQKLSNEQLTESNHYSDEDGDDSYIDEYRELDDEAKPIVHKKRGRPRKLHASDGDYKPPGVTANKRFKKPPTFEEVTEFDIDILSVIEADTSPISQAAQVNTAADFGTITVYHTEADTGAKEYIATVLGPTAVCHVCKTLHESVKSLEAHYLSDHALGIFVCKREGAVEMCKPCGKWYATKDDLRKHHTTMHNAQVYVEALAAYDEGGAIMEPWVKLPEGRKPLKSDDLNINIVEDASRFDKPRPKGAYVTLLEPFKFICYYCSARFRVKAFCEAHVRQKHFLVHSPYDCTACRRGFTSRIAYQSHVKHMHTENRVKFVCDLCGKGFTNMNNLRRHQNNHNDIRPFVCSTCGLDFTQRGSLDTHMRTHGYRDRYLCSFCCRGYKSIVKLREHQAHKHRQEETYECFICDEALGTGDELASHYVMHCSPEDESKAFSCHICSFLTCFPRDLHFHLKAHKRGRVKFPTKTRAKRERTQKGPFVCRFCQKRCVGKDYLDLHEFKHTREKKYTCDECGRQFTMAPQLRTHVQTRHNGLRYPCHVCGKQFTILANVQRHVVEIHEKKRPFSCDVCRKSFSQKSSLRIHERTSSHLEKLGRGYQGMLQVFENADYQIIEQVGS